MEVQEMNGEFKHHLRVEPYPYQMDGIAYGLEKSVSSLAMNRGLAKHSKALASSMRQVHIPALSSARPLSR